MAIDYTKKKNRNPKGDKDVEDGWKSNQKRNKDRDRTKRDVPLDEIKKSHQEKGPRNN
ncbi:MAG: hypothetical protein HOL66_13690 [Rhodospirillaceae bacterium]|jgi:hypothetical protein|nr:hypothetical protein [Rhodospirillaceae bacterium]MBT5245284.1 hypothetical protein [Rhodospirillaceae bacterium]MBT5563048.1 hypothetical protein [Rhodospirillaceae bacterium]MBT6241050.1 hypothetical protein [Rhodospirillaceae bacterium]MBT7138487.1 hypothetical protein [Rhodospirillaceae bacterium]